MILSPESEKSFQERCFESVMEVLRRHQIGGVEIQSYKGRSPWVAVRFRYLDRDYEVGIAEDDVSMTSGPSLFECYRRDEYESLRALSESFSGRLDRFLGGGDWDPPREKGFLLTLATKLWRSLRP